MSTEKKAPIQTFRDGGIKINLWEQETKSGQMYVTANIDKSYHTPDGQWLNYSRFIGEMFLF